MVKKFITLFKIGRKLALSDAINIVSKIYEIPILIKIFFSLLALFGKNNNIVNIIDQRVWNLTPHFLSYTLSKTGLWNLTRMLALALAPRIRVNGIGPGPTLRNVRQTEAQFQRQQDSVPLRRGASSEEVARAVRFIIESPSMTGQMIALDGGQHLGWAQPLPGAELEE